jgi:RHS repeat-associated protein
LEAGSFGYNTDDEMPSETYDANGNALTMSGKSFAYDSENHLTSMNGGQVQLIYDGDGNRVAKIVGGVTTQYLVDDLNPTGLPQVVEELVNGAVTRQYTYGLQRISENQIIANLWTPSFYEYDGGGSVRQLTNSTGQVTDKYEYDAFGHSFTLSGTTPNNYLYRGEQYDTDLWLYYLRARYYNPQTGRFLSRDPEDGVPSDPKTLHKYLYAGGDPVNRVDPSGRDMYEYGLMLGRFVVQVGPALAALTSGAVAIADDMSEVVPEILDDVTGALVDLADAAADAAEGLAAAAEELMDDAEYLIEEAVNQYNSLVEAAEKGGPIIKLLTCAALTDVAADIFAVAPKKDKLSFIGVGHLACHVILFSH